MIVVIFVSARAHMRYLRCSLVIYALGGEFHNVTTGAVCGPKRQHFTVILRYRKFCGIITFYPFQLICWALCFP